MRVGISDHLGWAVLVTVGPDGAVVDRRRIELVEPGVPTMPIHHDSDGLDDAAAAELVATVRRSIARAAGAALDELAAALPAPVASVSLRTWAPDFPQDIAVQRRVPWEARADAVMYRQEVADAARARGWEVHRFDAKQVLGDLPDHVLAAPRAALGPPWTKDHRLALAAALTAS